MDDFIKIYELLSSNWAGILVAITAVVGALVKVCTVLNILMPKIITNEKLARLEAVTSQLSFGTKKAEIVRKKP